MSKPHIHAESSAKKFGGKPKDYIEIHNLLDSSKAALCDQRHRALTHNSWFIGVILERIFGVTITNSEGKEVSVRDIGEQHALEDFGGKFIPSAQDWLINLTMQDWMDNGKGQPNSRAKEIQIQPQQIPQNPTPWTTPKPYDGTPPWPPQPSIID